jgi:predicted flavoprotein YhiN
MKAAPLLRAWLHRLRAAGVRFHVRHRWTGWNGGRAALRRRRGRTRRAPTVLALGGGSWPQLGSDGAWVPLLAARRGGGAAAAGQLRLRRGLERAFPRRFAGQPVKNVALAPCVNNDAGSRKRCRGEFLVTAVTASKAAWSMRCRHRCATAIEAGGDGTLHVDLVPGTEGTGARKPWTTRAARARWPATCKAASASAGVKAGPAAGMPASKADLADPARLAARHQGPAAAPGAPRPLDEAISSAGGVAFEALDEH